MTRREALKRTALVMGAAVSASATAALFSGCQTSGAGTELDWQPEFLTKEQGATVREVAERILPATDTPGAKDANVQEFIDLMLRDVYTPDERKIVTTGLEELQERAQNDYGSAFYDLEIADMNTLLMEINQTAYATPGGSRHWFSYLKELTIIGFFNSELGATEVARYEPVPGAYQGCVPLEQIGYVWATT